ncbi:MAG: NADH-quinone oxidoreductase subunit NuoF [Armatimonadetes bacterium]|nr:NADH-quinone oxidoreductase subunit NuoF [Armatimonadota bacterium]
MAERKVLLEHYEVDRIWELETYRQYGGYASLDELFAKEPAEWVEEVKASGLCGRGGAGFPTGVKWSFLAKGTGKPTYLVVNADESEPGTCHDRRLIERLSHQLIEGIICSCYAIEAHHAFVYIRGEYLEPYERLMQAIGEAEQAGLLGERVAGHDFPLRITVHRGAGAYICGEETALLSSLEGDKGQPRQKPPFPAVAGLYAAPTIVNNVQTICSIPHIVRHGAAWFGAINLAPESKSPGPRILSVSGHVNRPGIYEVENGTPFSEVIYDLCGGIRNGHDLKAIIPGGSSMPMLPKDVVMTTDTSFESIRAAGSQPGSGAVVVMDETTSIPEVVWRITKFYAHESCGKCTPCREGNPWSTKILRRFVDGTARPRDLEVLMDVVDAMEKNSFCPLGIAAAWAIQGAMRHFRHEFEARVQPEPVVAIAAAERVDPGAESLPTAPLEPPASTATR